MHEINEFAARLIKAKARRLIGQFGFTEGDLPDLEQELRAHLLKRLPDFDPGRSSLDVFVVVVLERHIVTLIQFRKTRKRGYLRRNVSLDEPIETASGTSRLADVFDHDRRRSARGYFPRGDHELANLIRDVRAVVERLPDDLEHLCHLLAVLSVAEVSRHTGVPRSTLYGLITKVRMRFEDAGLKKYL